MNNKEKIINENEKEILKNFFQNEMKEQEKLHPEDKNKIEDILNKKNVVKEEPKKNIININNNNNNNKKEKLNEWENSNSYKKEGIEIIGNKWGLKPVPKEFKMDENNKFNNEIGFNFKKETTEEDLMEVMRKKNEASENKLFAEFMEFANEDNNDVPKKLKENVEIKKEKVEKNNNNNNNNNDNNNNNGNSFADRVKMFSK